MSEPKATTAQPPQHSAHLALVQAFLRHTTPPRRDYPTNPITTTDPTCTPPPLGPRALSEATRPNDALTICTDLECLSTGRVPGRPGLARPPAPQDHDPKTAPRHPGLRYPRCACRVTLSPTLQVTNDVNYPQLVPEPRAHQCSSNPMPVQPDPIDPNQQAQTPQPGLQHPKTI